MMKKYNQIFLSISIMLLLLSSCNNIITKYPTSKVEKSSESSISRADSDAISNNTFPIVAAKFTKISVGISHTLALTPDGSVWAWGYNSDGQIGDGTTTNSLNPKMIISVGVRDISAGASSSFAIKNDGSLWAWGNYKFELPISDGVDRPDSYTPKKIIDGNVKTISAGNHALLLKEDGSLWAWGDNYSGEIGDGTTEERPLPKKIISGDVQNISAGIGFSVITKKDGSVWAWGMNDYYNIGDGTNEKRLIPTQILTSDFIQACAGYDHSVALKKDGTIWGWGYNSVGQIGVIHDTWFVDTPTKLPISDVKSLVIGSQYTMAIKQDGSLWAWGSNVFGQLGDGTTTDVETGIETPKQIISSGVKSVSTCSMHTFIFKTDGTIWAWGINDFGQLGDGTTTNSLVPKLIFSP